MKRKNKSLSCQTAIILGLVNGVKIGGISHSSHQKRHAFLCFKTILSLSFFFYLGLFFQKWLIGLRFLFVCIFFGTIMILSTSLHFFLNFAWMKKIIFDVQIAYILLLNDLKIGTEKELSKSSLSSQSINFLMAFLQLSIQQLVCFVFMSFQMGFLNNQLYRHFLYCFDLTKKCLKKIKNNNQLLNNWWNTVRKLIDRLERL